MPSKMLKTPVLPDKYYHIFNRANNNELVFKNHEDFQFFMQKLGDLVTDKIDVYSFCLMPNHFHLLIKPKFEAKRKGEESINECLRKFFQVYVQYFNKKYERKGSLFYKSFRRIEIKDEWYLKYLLFYIHYNPQKAMIVNDFCDYPYSSYRFYSTKKESKLRKDIVLAWFEGNVAEFESFHKECLERIKGIRTPSPGTPSQGMESLFYLPLPKSQSP